MSQAADSALSQKIRKDLAKDNNELDPEAALKSMRFKASWQLANSVTSIQNALNTGVNATSFPSLHQGASAATIENRNLLLPSLPQHNLTKGNVTITPDHKSTFRRVRPMKTDILTDAGRLGDVEDMSFGVGMGDGLTAYRSVLGSALDNLMEKQTYE